MPCVASSQLLTGPEDIGRSRWFWITFIAVCFFLFVYPFWLSEFGATNNAYYLLNVPIALGLALLWGYCGILSSGQVAYFGVAGYVYGIVAGNMIGNAAGPIIGSLCGVAICALAAAIFGYFVFYGRGRTGLCRSLRSFSRCCSKLFWDKTAGYQWRVGIVQLGGYNGMTGIPAFQIGQFVVTGYSFYYYVLVIVVVGYLSLRLLVNSQYGKVMLAIREDPIRTELLGYDIRARQLVVFVIAAVLAGISGLLYVQWGNYITPSQVGLLQASLPVIWVAVGGRESSACGLTIDLRAQLAQLHFVFGRLPVRSDHHRGAAGSRHVVLSGRHHSNAGARVTEARVARIGGFA